MLLGLLLHERANDIDEGLWTRESGTRLRDPRLDTVEHRGLLRLSGARKQEKPCRQGDCR
jgi:hypothetical protein